MEQKKVSPFLEDTNFFKSEGSLDGVNLVSMDMLKARGTHKYIKRTGGPGNYRYWYKNARGQLVEGKKPEEKQPGQSIPKVDQQKQRKPGPEIRESGMGITSPETKSALDKLKKTGEITKEMVKPLGMSDQNFARWNEFTPKHKKEVASMILDHYAKKASGNSVEGTTAKLSENAQAPGDVQQLQQHIGMFSGNRTPEQIKAVMAKVKAVGGQVKQNNTDTKNVWDVKIGDKGFRIVHDPKGNETTVLPMKGGADKTKPGNNDMAEVQHATKDSGYKIPKKPGKNSENDSPGGTAFPAKSESEENKENGPESDKLHAGAFYQPEEFKAMKSTSEEVKKIVTNFKRRSQGKGELKSISSAKELKAIIENTSFAFISAGRNKEDVREKNMAHDDKFFKDRHEKLKNHLKEKGYIYSEEQGKYGDPEPSIFVMIHDSNRDDILDIGKEFNQNSVLFSDKGTNEMIYTTGEKKGKFEAQGKGYAILPDADDYYTEFSFPGEKKKVRLNLALEFAKAFRAVLTGTLNLMKSILKKV